MMKTLVAERGSLLVMLLFLVHHSEKEEILCLVGNYHPAAGWNNAWPFSKHFINTEPRSVWSAAEAGHERCPPRHCCVCVCVGVMYLPGPSFCRLVQSLPGRVFNLMLRNWKRIKTK